MEILSDAEKMLESLPKADIERYTELIKDDYYGYIFYKRERNGDMNCSCSACGGEFNANINRLRTYSADEESLYISRHNDTVVCPKCKRKATLKCLGRIKNFSGFYEQGQYAFCEALSENEVIIRCYYVSKSHRKDCLYMPLKFRLESVYILQPKAAYRIYSDWFDRYSFDGNLKDPFLAGNSLWQKYFDYAIIGLKEVLENTFLKYSQLDGYLRYIRSHGIRFSSGNVNDGIKFIRYLCMYAKYPSIEMFIKMGLCDAVISLVQYNQPNNRLFDWEADKPLAALRCKDKHRFNEIIGAVKNGQINIVSTLKTEKAIKRFDDSITLADAQYFTNLDAEHMNMLKTMREMSGKGVMQLKRYLLKSNYYDSAEYLSNFIIGIWKDYIDAARKLGYDLSVANVVLPKDLRQAHDRAIAAVKYKENKEKLEFMKNLDVNRRKKYEYTDGELMIRLPHSMQEIIDEGKALSHCVGGYADRHADGKTTILFIRRCSEPNVPFYTLEIIGNKIIQYHGYANERNTNGKKDERVVKFVKKWHKWVEAGSRPQKTKGKSKTKAKQKLSA